MTPNQKMLKVSASLRSGLLSNYMPFSQRKVLASNIRGEEGEYFVDMLLALADRIEAMPQTGQTDGQGDKAVVHLHYFKGSVDAWITEKDMGSDDDAPADKGKQHQAFGLVDLGYGPELGYVSIEELISCDVELDLHWSLKSLAAVKGEPEPIVEPVSAFVVDAPAFPLLVVDAQVRYWEDAEINGVSDESGESVPLKVGESWMPVIDLSTGQIKDWPIDTVADIHFKVCDAGEYWLADANETKLMKWKGSYVPDAFLAIGDEGYGDYIIMKVNKSGMIDGWRLPVIDADEWQAIG